MSQPDTNSPRSVSCTQQLHKTSEKLCGHQLKERSQLRLPECSSARNNQPKSFTFKLNKDFTVCHQKTGDGSLRLCDTSDPSGASRCVCGYFSVSVATETRVWKETGGIFQPCLLQRKQVFESKVFVAEPTQRRHEREIWNQTNKQKVATKKRTKCNQLMFIMAVDCLSLVTIHSQMIREDFQFIEQKKEETSLHPAAHHTHHSDLRGTRDWSCQTDAGEIWSRRTE